MVVRMRANKAHRNNRRSHHALKGARVSACSNCQTMRLSHFACPNCGLYNGHNTFDATKKLAKKEKKIKAKENLKTK